MNEREKLLVRAQTAKRESKQLDFKSTFDPAKAECWCEIIKDIVAFANTGGGAIVFGVLNDGTSANIEHSPILSLDAANITNKIFKYTNYQFSDIEIIEVSRSGNVHAAFLVAATNVPIVFTKPGTYDVGDGHQKTAFGQGTVYFRHGTKSEPAQREDLVAWRDREIKRVRHEWLDGVRKVVKAPSGATIAVVPQNVGSGGAPRVEARITSSPKATSFVPQNAEEIWPHRQKSLLSKVNRGLPRTLRINGHDILCVNRKIDVLKAHPEFAYKSHHLTSPQYSDNYADWLVAQARDDSQFFKMAREEYRNR